MTDSSHLSQTPNTKDVIDTDNFPLCLLSSYIGEMKKTGSAICLKYFSLVVLVAQNTALVLTMRYSRISMDGEKMYLASTAVVLTELMKFTICLSAVFYNADMDIDKTINLLRVEILVKIKETAKVSVPSILYTVQNNLLYVALTHLNAVTFQLTYQLKIITTALFSVLLLKKSLSKTKWISLLVLMVAVVLVQLPSETKDANKDNSDEVNSSLVGVIAVLLACVSSGFSGVYTEKIMKQPDTSMWIRNIQLSTLSFFVGLFGVFVSDRKAILTDGFFQGYSPIVFLVITLQALGGIIVATVMKYADNILKGFATSLSIVFSSLVSIFVLKDFTFTWYFGFGTILVLVATLMYNRPPPQNTLPVTDSLASNREEPKGS